MLVMSSKISLAQKGTNKMLRESKKLLKYVNSVMLGAFALTFLLPTNNNTVKAQALQVSSYSGWKWVQVGPNDPNSTTPGENHYLTFGNANSTSNTGIWGLGVVGQDLNLNRLWNVVNPGNGVVYIKNNWNVGIGVGYSMDPKHRLDVRGDIGSNGTIWHTSDKRYKKDIQPLSENVSNLLKLNSVKYHHSSDVLHKQLESFKQTQKDVLDANTYQGEIKSFERQIKEREADTATKFGFIAQELREVYPNLVHEDDDGYLSVNYIGLIPVLVDAIKEQQKQIDELRGNGFVKPTTEGVMSNAMLYQNNPNPFTENTEIKFYVPEESNRASICIYDLVGSEIMKLDLTARGYSSITIHGSKLKAGMYLYALLVDGKEVDTKRMILTNN